MSSRTLVFGYVDSWLTARSSEVHPPKKKKLHCAVLCSLSHMVAFGKIVLPAIAAVSVVLPGGVARSHLRAARASKLHPALTTGDQWLAHLKQEDLQASLLNFENATLKHSNLGGLGPDKGPETLVISQAGAREGTTISMKFTVADGHTYSGKPENNGVSNGISTINVLNGASTSLNVELEDDKGNAVTLDRFFMTVFDIDAGSVAGDGTDPGKKAGVEEVEFTGINGYYMHPDAQILVTEKQDGFLGLVANLTGTEGDNPSSPWSLTKDQLRKTVMVEYVNVSSFTMNLAIGSQPGTNGRNFQLAGISDLIYSPFGPCAVATYVDLSQSTVSYNNLAGVEPTKQALVFSNAVSFLGSSVDLVITVFGGSYNPTAPSSNGFFGSLGQIDMGPKAKVKVDFTFVKTGTSVPVALPLFSHSTASTKLPAASRG